MLGFVCNIITLPSNDTRYDMKMGVPLNITVSACTILEFKLLGNLSDLNPNIELGVLLVWPVN